MKITFSTSAFLSPLNKEHPTLEIPLSEIPAKYDRITVTAFNDGTVVIPEGIDDEGRPYFSDKFYQERLKKHKEVAKYDKEAARNLLWFNVEYEY